MKQFVADNYFTLILPFYICLHFLNILGIWFIWFLVQILDIWDVMVLCYWQFRQPCCWFSKICKSISNVPLANTPSSSEKCVIVHQLTFFGFRTEFSQIRYDTWHQRNYECVLQKKMQKITFSKQKTTHVFPPWWRHNIYILITS